MTSPRAVTKIDNEKTKNKITIASANGQEKEKRKIVIPSNFATEPIEEETKKQPVPKLAAPEKRDKSPLKEEGRLLQDI